MSVAVDTAVAIAEYGARMRRFERRNFALLVLDGATFAFAISLLSEATILPAFVQALSGSAVLVGLVGATFAIGHYLPQLIGAHLVHGKPRRKPALLAIVIAERVGILAIALVAQMVGIAPPTVVLVLFFVAFCGYAITTGLIGPVYGDFLAKSLPRSRGWYYGISQLLGGLLGFVAALIGESLLREYAFPLGNQLCFWLCFALSFLSIFFIGSLHDEDYPEPEPRQRLRDTLREIPALIRGDRPYARFLIARSFLAFSTLGVGFVVVYGLQNGLRPSDAAILAAVYILAQAFGGFGLSLLGNYAGWKIVVVIGGALLILGMGGALFASGLVGYALVYAALGAANAVTIIGDPNMSIEFSPASTTSLYLGTTSTLLAPFFVLGPLLGGWLAQYTGYLPVFAVAGTLAVVGFVLAVGVQEPRKRVVGDVVGQPGVMP